MSEELCQLPDLYKIDGIKCEVTVPKTNEKIITVVPLEHMAYNVVFPQIAKELGAGKKEISEYVRAVNLVDSSKYGGN